MAASHVGFIRQDTLNPAVTKIIDFVAGKAFGVDKVKKAVSRYANFFQNYQIALVGSLEEPQKCYESDDDADIDDKDEMDLLYNLHEGSPGTAIHEDIPVSCNVDHIPNTVKYTANLLQNHFMFLTITNVMKGTVRFVILFHFTLVYIKTI